MADTDTHHNGHLTPNGSNGHGEARPISAGRLSALRLHGYKSFASVTTLTLDAGITAVVGPNGSGKSNIADAIRWALGEQSHQMLRGKRTEDMIFNGTEQRARVGMAEVQITFDNSAQWLPVPYAEVTLARRAYRSGENEYLQNGVRVRLRDVAELLSSAGLGRHSYTIIGQGLVDQALFVSAEERSRLIEDAAGISVYQDKRTQALARLADTDANRARVLDLLADIEPRLGTLAAQARRAEEAQKVHDALSEQLRRLYAFRWHQAADALAQAQQAEEAARQRVAQAERQLDAVTDTQSQQTAQRQALDAELSVARQGLSSLESEQTALRHEVAVRTERAQHLGQRLTDFRANLARQTEQLASLGQERQRAERQLEQMARQIVEARQHLAAAEENRNRQRLLRQQALAESEATRQRALTARTVLADVQRRLKQAHAQREDVRRKHDAHVAALAEAAKQARTQESRLSEVTAALAQADARRSALEAEREAIVQAARAADEQVAAARDAASELKHETRRLQERFALLNRLRDEGSGYGNAVRVVLNAASSHADSQRRPARLTGVVGTVGSLLRVPSRFEVAIEAALAGRLQNVVVETWHDAEQAIDLLKRTKSGRATFLPLDTLRVPSPLLIPPKEPGMLGLASAMVEVEPRLRRMAEAMLNRTVLVEDLPTAQRIFGRVADAGGTMVTLEGDLVRAGGSVSGGSQHDGRDHGLLSREREWRELPARIERLQQQLLAAQQTMAQLESAASARHNELAAADAALRQLGSQRGELQRQHAESQRAVDRTAQARDWTQRMVAQAAEALARTDADWQTLTAEAQRLEEVTQQAEAEAAQAAASARTADDETWLRAVAEAQAAHAALQSAYEARAGALKALRSQEDRLRGELEAVTTRSHHLEVEQSAEALWLREAKSRQAALTDALDAQRRALAPLEARQRQLDAQLQQLTARVAQATEELQAALAHFGHLQLQRQRAEDRIAQTRADIERDLAPATGGMEQPTSQTFTLDAIIAAFPPALSLPAGLTDDIQQLQARLRRIGAVNPDAPREYADMQQRHNFLRQQADDLHTAADNLRLLIAELDAVIEKTFRLTFDEVAERFAHNFAHLFGGGSARLELQSDDNGRRNGVEITARLPGKRPQPLGLLSGGERALTAVSLLFSILQVSPTPFCVLDEVDAMLDEANVGRFRDMLRLLAQKIQFVVVSHNRTTIEAADAVYGVSMGADGVSRVVAVRPTALARA